MDDKESIYINIIIFKVQVVVVTCIYVCVYLHVYAYVFDVSNCICHFNVCLYVCT